MGLLKHPDGQKQLEVISNSISIDYVVHRLLGMLHKPLPLSATNTAQLSI